MDPSLVTIFVVVAVGFALVFECVNGFHDTANAVATVIYTRALPARVAVVYSGIWNLIGVLVSGGAVAYGVVALLPIELLTNVSSAQGFALLLAVVVSALAWNVGTWWRGLPVSSTHTLVGALLGVGLAHSLIAPPHVLGAGIDWRQVRSTVIALATSPLVGFGVAGMAFALLHRLVPEDALYREPGDRPPPWWIRGLLVLTCTGVSFAHGSNDGQKGMGLITLILVGLMPATYAIDAHAGRAAFARVADAARAVNASLPAQARRTPVGDPSGTLRAYLDGGAAPTPARLDAAIAVENARILAAIRDDVPGDAATRTVLRTRAYELSTVLERIGRTDPARKTTFLAEGKALDAIVKYVPLWVKICVACALGFGTMVGWRRIVVTVGERIGKQHLTYGGGVCAELVAAITILFADRSGMPVSTTHVLSSGVAGTMVANRSGIQPATVRNIVLAWVLTIPVCIVLGSGLFSATLYAIASLGTR